MAKVNTLNQEQIKEVNRVNILHILRDQKETTKQEIASILKLSIPTVTTYINQLLDEGFVIEAGVAKSTGGRKPVILKFAENAKYSFGINITPKVVRIVLVNLRLHIIEEMEYPYSSSREFQVVLDTLQVQIKDLMIKHSIEKRQVVGVGIALPGLVDEDHLILENAPNLGVNDFDFHDFEKEIGIKVSIENEANIAAYAEASIGIAKNKQSLVYISVTEGVGTGIIIDGQIYKSKNKKAGEFGHMRISDENLKCNCGRTGCWELYASKKALLRYYEKYAGIKATSVGEIVEKLNQDDEAAKQTFDEYIDKLFVGIENIILGLNPEYVVVGGELGKYKSQLLHMMEESKALKSSHIEYEGTKVIISSLENKGSLLGAAILALEDVFNYKKSVI